MRSVAIAVTIVRMENRHDWFEVIVRRTHRVPLPGGPSGDGSVVALQADAALMDAGWKLSGELLACLSGLAPGPALDAAVRILAVARREAGDHVRHNSYFIDFPANVPDTLDFWLHCIAEALATPETAGPTAIQLAATGTANLLGLPSYGTYQRTWEEMIAAHRDFIPAVSDRLTILNAGSALDDEISELYLSLAGSRVPLSEDDAAILADAALECATGPQPEVIPVRENRAIINRVRLAARAPLLADTVTDVLRLAVALSDGDVSLQEPARFRSFSRQERRALLASLDAVVAGSEARLGDVSQRPEQWKRLGERLHPHEFPQWPQAAQVFAVARRDRRFPSLASRAEAAFCAGDADAAAAVLSAAPGMFFRSADRLLRTAANAGQRAQILGIGAQIAPRASCRVLLSLREHLLSRVVPTNVSRVFAGRGGRGMAAADTRARLDPESVNEIAQVLDTEIGRRLSFTGPVLVDPAVREVALPLSAKVMPDGLGIMPRGSVSLVAGDVLRFFCSWRQRERRTDYDLSVVMLDRQYASPEHVSWTNYRTGYATYSGDITDAPDGATEFIDIRLREVPREFVLPQVHVFAGEGFAEAEESFFGFMLRDHAQEGAPFEPRTVRAKSDLRGSGRVALPVAFMRGEDGRWRAKWMHLYLRGHVNFNRVEGNRVTTSLLTRAVLEREYLTVGYLAGLARARGTAVTGWDGTIPGEPVTFIGLERPEGLAPGSQVITLRNLADLIPE
jgi:hypothetical protein